jgi:GcrA cell cycle regulator
MRTDFWTKERIATLERLWAQGKSAGTIAAVLGGISRSAVLGKIFRLRLGDAPKPAAKTQRTDKAATQALRKPRAKGHGPARRRGAELMPPPRPPRRKSLFELTNQCCRWPQGSPGTKSFFFCGAPGADVESGVPYCAAHMQRAYIVPPDYAGKTRTSLTPWRTASKATSRAA